MSKKTKKTNDDRVKPAITLCMTDIDNARVNMLCRKHNITKVGLFMSLVRPLLDAEFPVDDTSLSTINTNTRTRKNIAVAELLKNVQHYQ